jgi:hypothetical protein
VVRSTTLLGFVDTLDLLLKSHLNTNNSLHKRQQERIIEREKIEGRWARRWATVHPPIELPWKKDCWRPKWDNPWAPPLTSESRDYPQWCTVSLESVRATCAPATQSQCRSTVSSKFPKLAPLWEEIQPNGAEVEEQHTVGQPGEAPPEDNVYLRIFCLPRSSHIHSSDTSYEPLVSQNHGHLWRWL